MAIQVATEIVSLPMVRLTACLRFYFLTAVCLHRLRGAGSAAPRRNGVRYLQQFKSWLGDKVPI